MASVLYFLPIQTPHFIISRPRPLFPATLKSNALNTHRYPSSTHVHTFAFYSLWQVSEVWSSKSVSSWLLFISINLIPHIALIIAFSLLKLAILFSRIPFLASLTCNNPINSPFHLQQLFSIKQFSILKILSILFSLLRFRHWRSTCSGVTTNKTFFGINITQFIVAHLAWTHFYILCTALNLPSPCRTWKA